jgi:hypothetical protein
MQWQSLHLLLCDASRVGVYIYISLDKQSSKQANTTQQNKQNKTKQNKTKQNKPEHACAIF